MYLILGTEEERGIKKWRDQLSQAGETKDLPGIQIYDFPFVQKYFNKVRLFRYIPFCPSFMTNENSDPERPGKTVNVKDDNTMAGMSTNDNTAFDKSDETGNTQL